MNRTEYLQWGTVYEMHKILRPSVMHHYNRIFIIQCHTYQKKEEPYDVHLFSGRNTIQHVITLLSQLYYILSLWFLSIKMIFHNKKYNIVSKQGLLLQ